MLNVFYKNFRLTLWLTTFSLVASKFMIMRKFCLILLVYLLLICPPRAFAQILGTSPSRLDLGVVEPGERRLVSFYVFSRDFSDLWIKVNPLYEDPLSIFSIINKKVLENVSQEDSTTWLEFIENPVKLKPLPPKIAFLKGIAKSASEVSFFLKVPENAEPGYHAIYIRPESITKLPTKTGIGISVRAFIQFPLIFYVKGVAIRKAKIIDIVPRRVDKKLELRVITKNEGTVTLISRIKELKITNENTTKTFSSNWVVLKPGEIKSISITLDKSVEPGNYTTTALLSYGTGIDIFNTTLEIPEIYEIKEKKEVKFPLAYILLFLIILLTLIVYFKIR